MHTTIETEQAVLCEFLLWGHFTDEIDKQTCRTHFDRLGCEDFTDPSHQTIFAAMIDLDASGEVVTLPAVTARIHVGGGLDLKDWEVYVTSLIHAGFTTGQLAWYVDRMLEASGRRVLLQAANLLLAEAKTTAPSIEAALAVVSRMLDAVRAGFPSAAHRATQRMRKPQVP